jgi:citrate lyase subunit beta/citryl-CoA lyase
VDGVTTATDDDALVAADTQYARRLGFGARLCIHPRQVAPVHEAFAATPAEVAWARRVLAAAQAAGGGAVQLDGRMIDRPVIAAAEKILASLS